MTKTIHTTVISYAELVSLAKRIGREVRQHCLGKLIDKALDRIEDLIVKLEQAMGKDLSSEFTAMLDQKDQARDAAFILLRDLVALMSKRISQPALAQAGQLLDAIFEERDTTLYTLGYTGQTAALELLFQDLDKPEAQQALEKLDALSWYDELKAAQLSFEETMHEKAKVDAGENPPLLKQSKTELGIELNDLIVHIRFCARLEEAGYAELAAVLDQHITDMHSEARARRTRANSNKKG